MKNRRLVLIDSHALLFRAYYAIPFLTAPDGRMVNAVFGFTSTLLNVIDELEPTHIAACFDSRGPTFRKVEFDDYKANREKPPDELIEQFDLAREVVEAFNVPMYAWQGFEADDLIGTLAFQAKSLKTKNQKPKIKHTGKKSKLDEGVETIIVTGDLDTLQLVDDGGKVRVYVPGRRGKPTRIYKEEDVVDKMQIRNDQVVDYKGLAGDASDNIPGIRGVGPKTAVGLLKEFGSIDGVYEYLDGLVDGGKVRSSISEIRNKSEYLISNIKTKEDERLVRAKITPSVLKKLVEGRELAFKSRELARIVTDVPIELDLEECKVSGYDKTVTSKLFEELGFKSLVNRLPKDEFEVSVQEALF